MKCGGKEGRRKPCDSLELHAKGLDCGSIAAALESHGMAAAPQRCGGVYESGGIAAAVQTTTASSLTGQRRQRCYGVRRQGRRFPKRQQGCRGLAAA
jgi:hypothetical protein